MNGEPAAESPATGIVSPETARTDDSTDDSTTTDLPGLMLSTGSRGGYAVPRQLAGRRR